MQKQNKAKLLMLQLYVLQHSDLEQAAWVRASTSWEASTKFSKTTNIPVIVPNDYGWVLFPEGRQHTNDEKRPLPHWEYLIPVNGSADLRGMPKHIRALGESSAPRRQGQVKVGREFARSTLKELHSVPALGVADSVKVFHSGYYEPYPITASQMRGLHGKPSSVDSGKNAILELVEKEPEYYPPPRTGDFVKVRLNGNDGDYFVSGRVVGKSVIVNVVSIEKVKVG